MRGLRVVQAVQPHLDADHAFPRREQLRIGWLLRCERHPAGAGCVLMVVKEGDELRLAAVRGSAGGAKRVTLVAVNGDHGGAPGVGLDDEQMFVYNRGHSVTWTMGGGIEQNGGF